MVKAHLLELSFIVKEALKSTQVKTWAVVATIHYSQKLQAP
jgi:hypothetical protein